MNKFSIIALSLGLLILTTSCNFDKRKVKKFFKRLNAHEVNSSSSYIISDDQANLYYFNNQYWSGNGSDFEILEMERQTIGGKPCVIVKLRCNNCSEDLMTYFKNKKVLQEDIITDTIFVKKVNGDKYLSFDLGGYDPQLSKILRVAQAKSNSVNIRSGPGIGYSIISTLKKSDEVTIDDGFINSEWRKCIFTDEKGELTVGYIASSLTEIQDVSYFQLGWFGKLGLLGASIIALVVLIVVFPLMLTTIFRTAGDNAVFALILFGVLIVIVLLTYEIIEGVLFELFLINLPF
jgi:uncharacterized protein YgiM (DUF1202 family)